MFKKLFACAAALAAVTAVPAEAQEKARLNWVAVQSPAIEGNLEGNSAERKVLVVTPPGYDENSAKRYPVVYFLHGYWMPVEAQQEGFKLHEAVQAAAAAGNDVIMVMPDGFSKLRGGFYSSSPTVGYYESFVVDELVEWVDANYRTVAKRESRGLAGHSMGGYGTLKVAMKYPGVFSSIYAMAPCCLSPANVTAEQLQTVADLTAEHVAAGQGFALAVPAQLSAWAPDPKNPPYYVSTTVKDGAVDPLLNARLHANSPLVLLPQYLRELKALEAIRVEVGDKDFLLRDDTWMHEELERFGVNHEWRLFEGDHGNRVNARIRSDLLPFFGAHLDK